MTSRMSLPSLLGVRPRSDFWIAFSMAAICEASHGWMTRVRASGTEIVATWLMGWTVP
jgi:hypothetical protein